MRVLGCNQNDRAVHGFISNQLQVVGGVVGQPEVVVVGALEHIVDVPHQDRQVEAFQVGQPVSK
jgi:hypothetical protein